MGKEHEVGREKKKKSTKTLKERRMEKKMKKVKDPAAFGQIHIE